jgi:23S rRNA (uracil1939-C5)-methyltransferase
MANLLPRPLEKGEKIELSIDTVAFGGAGIGRYGDMVVFVPFTVDGDRVSAEIVSVKKRFANAELKSVLIPSPFRVAPLCGAYMRCGACSYQHIAYDYQLLIKKMHVGDALKRIGRFDHIPLEDTIPSPKPYAYRGKADFHAAINGRGIGNVGFAERKTHSIVDLDRCEINHESINEALSKFKQTPSSTGRFSLWADSAPDTTEPYITRHVRDKEILVPSDGFFQTNLFLTDALVGVVEDFCNLKGAETVLDGYCGSGLFSIFLGSQCKRVYGIETGKSAVLCAEMNVNEAGINTASFHTGDMARILRKRFIRKNLTVDVAVVDPPRTGMTMDALIALIELKTSRIVYVSCNPATLARDLRTLAGYGYSIMRVRPLDMFPQTSHIETVVLLEPQRHNRLAT